MVVLYLMGTAACSRLQSVSDDQNLVEAQQRTPVPHMWSFSHGGILHYPQHVILLAMPQTN